MAIMCGLYSTLQLEVWVVLVGLDSPEIVKDLWTFYGHEWGQSLCRTSSLANRSIRSKRLIWVISREILEFVSWDRPFWETLESGIDSKVCHWNLVVRWWTSLQVLISTLPSVKFTGSVCLWCWSCGTACPLIPEALTSRIPVENIGIQHVFLLSKSCPSFRLDALISSSCIHVLNSNIWEK